MATPKANVLRRIFPVRMLPDERKRIEDLADLAGLNTSEYIRRCALGKRIRSRINLTAMNELRRLGGLQKFCLIHIHDPENRRELNRVLNQILATIKQIENGRDN
jgi:hypothetical protein